MNRYKVTLTFTEEILGATPKDPEIYRTWTTPPGDLTEEQLAEELETLERREEKGWTGFHMLKGTPLLYDYVVKGFFKDACGMLRRASDTKSAKLQAYKKVVDGMIFVTPRRILLNLNGGKMGTNERPLRASTAQGDRVALARSDTCPIGTTMEFMLTILGAVPQALLREWLDYGALRGLGQWRNAGWGTFTYELEKLG